VVLPDGAPHEIQTVNNYRFNVSAPIGCTRLCVGETKAGNTAARSITAKVIESEDLQEFFEKEGRVLHTLHNRPHPGFPKLIGTVQAENDGRSFIVMNELGMDLNAYVRAERGLPEDEVQVLFRQLVSSVAHCHKNQIVLRDMKLGKIFFSTSQPGQAQLVFADLDGAEVMSNGNGKVGQLKDQKGSPAYVCPEVLCCKPYGGYAADMWSLGVVLYRMLTGNYPFHDSVPARLFDKILLGSSAIHFPSTVSSAARDMIRRLLERNPAARPTAKNLLQDAWLQHNHDDATATLRRRRSFSTRTSTSALFPACYSSPAAVAGSEDGCNDAGARVSGSSSSRRRRNSSSSSSSSSSSESVGMSVGVGSRSSSSMLRRRGSTSSLSSDDGNERDVGDDADEQLVPDYEDDDEHTEPITPVRGKTFNLGGSANSSTRRRGGGGSGSGSSGAARAKAKAGAEKKKLSTKVVSAFDKEQREAAAATVAAAVAAAAATAAAIAAVAAKKRPSVELVADRCIRRRVSQKGFVRPVGLLGWDDNQQGLEISPSPSPTTTAEQHVATA